MPPEVESAEPAVKRGLLSTPWGEMTGGQRATIGCLGLLIIIVLPAVVVCAVTLASTDSGAPAPYREPTLAEYWDRSACYDLFTRTEAANRAGISRADWIASLSRAEGAVKRYGGPARVMGHCESRFGSEWRNR